MNFSEYLKSFAEQNTPIGDLARDFISSKSRATTYIGIVKSMKKYQPCDEAWEMLDKIHNEYLNRIKEK